MIRCHSLGSIMGAAKSIDPALMTDELVAIKKKVAAKRTDDEQALLDAALDLTLSEGAKTYLKALAREHVYGFKEQIGSKYLDKGIICEDASIALYNSVFFQSHKKNTERRDNGIISGECDLVVPGIKGIDIKTAWSLATFPVLSEDCHDIGYEWQSRGYMALWDVPEWDIAYCMVSTPEDLLRFEQRELHEVDHIDPQLRVTTITYQRDMTLEKKMLVKAELANAYIQSVIERIKAEHGA